MIQLEHVLLHGSPTTVKRSPTLNELGNWLSSTAAAYLTAHDLASAQEMTEPQKKPEIKRG